MRVVRRLVPVYLERTGRGKAGGRACEVVRPTDLVARLGWAPATVTAVECPELPRIHGILVDLSGSMEGFGFRMTPGLEAYTKELAGGTSVALATTGDEFRCLRPAMDVTSP